MKNIGKYNLSIRLLVRTRSMTLSVFPSGFNDNALIEQLQVSILDKKNGTNMSRYLSYIQIVNNMISAIPDDRGVGGMTVKVVERRRQNDKACKDLFLKIHSCDLSMM
ncbi:hypothetical protein H8356DRAFT_1427242 [Neocallimastix lanati (nom. inval.)]|nr:hypothetical protein H8356DRAFT_1427242 [Neocallimastix sp. JGI-2020a]